MFGDTTEAPRCERAALLGDSKAGRTSYVEQGGPLALREVNWKYIRPSKGPKRFEATNTEPGNDPAGLLFDLSTDLAEQNSLVEKEAGQFERMGKRLDDLQRQGRSR